MKRFYRIILIIFLLGLVSGLLLWSVFLFTRKSLRSWCSERGLVYQYSRYRFRLPGRLSLYGFQLQKSGGFSFAAEHIEVAGNPWGSLFGRWEVKNLQISNGTLNLPETLNTGKVQLSQITLDLQSIAPGASGFATMRSHIDEVDLLKHGLWRAGKLEINATFNLSETCLFNRLQGSINAADVELSQAGRSLGTLSTQIDCALCQEAADSWQIIPGAGEAVPLNQIRTVISGRQVLNAVLKSGTWKKEGAQQHVSLEVTATSVDSEPLLTLISPEAYAWGSGQLNYLQLDLRSYGEDTEGLLHNLEGSAAFDIASLQLKNSPFIEIFSRRTGLNLPEFLHFDRGSGILKMGSQACHVLTTSPFQGRHPVIEANGRLTFDGALQLQLDLGFSPELEQLLETKRYFRPFARLCRRNDGHLMLPGPLILTGTLQNPAVDLTDLLKASAKAGLKNFFEEAGRIGIRLRRSGNDDKTSE